MGMMPLLSVTTTGACELKVKYKICSFRQNLHEVMEGVDMDYKIRTTFTDEHDVVYGVGDMVTVHFESGGGLGGCLITKVTNTGFKYTQGKREKSLQFKDIIEINMQCRGSAATNLDKFGDIDFVAVLLNKYGTCPTEVCIGSPYYESGGCSFEPNVETHNCIECTKLWLEKPVVERTCRVCGCTWENACLGGCYWVESDLCSQCTVVIED